MSEAGRRRARQYLPLAVIPCLLIFWEVGLLLFPHPILPGPSRMATGFLELLFDGRLLRFSIASLFRVSWGFLAALVVGIPFGMLIGWFPTLERAVGPLLQLFRPISSVAWMPFAILWFGVGDLTAIFIIALACFGPFTVLSLNAVRRIPAVNLNSGRNFGFRGLTLLRRVVLPAMLPPLVVGLRQTIYVAWAVVVMAEMVAVNSGLGFLIVDARNSGNRYDLVFAGMLAIGLIGVALDLLLRQLETLPQVRWGIVTQRRDDLSLHREQRRFIRPA